MNFLPFLQPLPYEILFFRSGVYYKQYCNKHLYACLTHMQMLLWLLRSRMAWPWGIHDSVCNRYCQMSSTVAELGYMHPSVFPFHCILLTSPCHRASTSDGRKMTFNFNRYFLDYSWSWTSFLHIYWTVVFIYELPPHHFLHFCIYL